MPEDSSEPRATKRGVSRRQFFKGVGIASAGTALAPETLLPESAEAAPLTGTHYKPGTHTITLKINGRPIALDVEPRTTLLYALRNHTNPPLTGTKLVCDQGACGACTVHVNGKSMYSCNLLATDMQGKEITTVEGLTSPDGKMHPLQEEFIEKDALMCGFCTPGFIMAISAQLHKKPNSTLDEIKQACAGNVCRCGTYPHIFEAAIATVKKMRGGA